MSEGRHLVEDGPSALQRGGGETAAGNREEGEGS
jgi:hypothetical protein